MIHYTYKGLFHYIKKKDSYAWFQAKMAKDKNKTANYFNLVFKPFYRFSIPTSSAKDFLMVYRDWQLPPLMLTVFFRGM